MCFPIKVFHAGDSLLPFFPGGCSRFQVTGKIKGFFGLKFLILGYFWIGKFDIFCVA